MNAALAGPSLAVDTPIDVLVARSVMQVRVVRIPRAMVAVAVAVIALDYALRGHVDPAAWHLWALRMVASGVPRTALCFSVRKRIDAAGKQQLDRYDNYMSLSTALSSAIMGAAFWMVATSGDDPRASRSDSTLTWSAWSRISARKRNRSGRSSAPTRVLP